MSLDFLFCSFLLLVPGFEAKCKYFSGSSSTYTYTAPDVCLTSGSVNGVESAQIYQCSKDGNTIYHYEFSNIEGDEYCSFGNTVKTVGVYNKSDKSVSLNCDGADCYIKYTVWDTCGLVYNNYQEAAIVSDMCGGIDNGESIQSQKYLCDNTTIIEYEYKDTSCQDLDGSKQVNTCDSTTIQQIQLDICTNVIHLKVPVW